MRAIALWISVAVALAAVLPTLALAQRPDTTTRDTTALALSAGESEGEPRRRNLIPKQEFNLGFTTFSYGMGLLWDFATYTQDDDSKEQIDLSAADKLRDFRVLARGRFKTTRLFTWQVGYMYDAPSSSWRFRQTGLTVGVPEIASNFFVGRTKEGISLNKVMVGYYGWTMERFTFSDAIPILADGVKWILYLPKFHFYSSVGWYTDLVSRWETFSTYDNQFVVRTVWAPLAPDSAGTVFHLGLSGRNGKVNQGQLQVRARPEAFPAPYFIDTGKFPARTTFMMGPEIYYRPGAFLFGSEYYFLNANSPEKGNPVFSGGDIFASWMITGETRRYNAAGAYFRDVLPNKTVLQGGPGAWEALVRFSYSDLDDAAITGGTFWRITPMVNWYLTDWTRLEFVYGYGVLDRFALKGATQFFQSRIQLQF
jgi:phosphate-selective porin OprO and OprP